MRYTYTYSINVRNCAPWNGALTVTGGSIGLSGCSPTTAALSPSLDGCGPLAMHTSSTA